MSSRPSAHLVAGLGSRATALRQISTLKVFRELREGSMSRTKRPTNVRSRS